MHKPKDWPKISFDGHVSFIFTLVVKYTYIPKDKLCADTPTACRSSYKEIDMRKPFMFVMAVFVVAGLAAAPLTPAQKSSVEVQMKQFLALGTDPVVVKAVKEYIAAQPAELKGMTQEIWTKLSVLSPQIKYLTKNPLAEYLKTKKTEIVAELFVSAPNGEKVAFFSKTTSWSHKGKAKHEDPMKGKTWIGETELDESTGKQSVQFSFPVMDGSKVIGSIVIGLDLSLLK